jgi:hypothetical protein
MHPWRKAALLSIAGIIALFLCFHLAVNIFGKVMLAAKLQEAFGKKVTIAAVGTYFPSGVTIKNLEVEDLCKIEEISAGGGLFDIFRGRISLSALKLVRPRITLSKGLPVAAQAPDSKPAKPAETESALASLPEEKIVLPRIFIGRLVVDDGVFNFIDFTVSKDGLEIKVEHLNLKVTNLNLGGKIRRKSEFQLQGSIPWREGQDKGSIYVKGWLDAFKKNMEATLKIEKIDGIYLYPYYSMWMDIQGARIEKANLNFTSDIKGVNNNAVAVCHLELTDIVRKPLGEGESEDNASKMTNAVLDIFRALDKGKVVLDFVIRTKMDRPELGFGNIRMAFEDKISKAHSEGIKPKDILILPAKILQGAGKGAVDLSKSVMDGIFAMGRQIRGAAVDTLVKPPKVAVPAKK